MIAQLRRNLLRVFGFRGRTASLVFRCAVAGRGIKESASKETARPAVRSLLTDLLQKASKSCYLYKWLGLDICL